MYNSGICPVTVLCKSGYGAEYVRFGLGRMVWYAISQARLVQSPVIAVHT